MRSLLLSRGIVFGNCVHNTVYTCTSCKCPSDPAFSCFSLSLYNATLRSRSHSLYSCTETSPISDFTIRINSTCNCRVKSDRKSTTILSSSRSLLLSLSFGRRATLRLPLLRPSSSLRTIVLVSILH